MHYGWNSCYHVSWFHTNVTCLFNVCVFISKMAFIHHFCNINDKYVHCTQFFKVFIRYTNIMLKGEVINVLNDFFTIKWKRCPYLFTFMLFRTCINLFSNWNKKGYVLKNVLVTATTINGKQRFQALTKIQDHNKKIIKVIHSTHALYFFVISSFLKSYSGVIKEIDQICWHLWCRNYMLEV